MNFLPKVAFLLSTVYYLLSTASPSFAQFDFSSEELKRRALPADLQAQYGIGSETTKEASGSERLTETGKFWQAIYDGDQTQPQEEQKEKSFLEKLLGTILQFFTGKQGFINFIRPADSPSWEAQGSEQDRGALGLATQDLIKSMHPAGLVPSLQYLAGQGITTNLSLQFKDILEGANLENPEVLTLQQIDLIIKGSPIEGSGQHTLAEAKRTRVNPALILSIAWKETNFGKTGAGQTPTSDSDKNNCRALVGISASDNTGCPRKEGGYYVPYTSYSAAITGAFDLIRTLYFDDFGTHSVAAIESRYSSAGQICNLERIFIAFSRGHAPNSPDFASVTSLPCTPVQVPSLR